MRRLYRQLGNERTKRAGGGSITDMLDSIPPVIDVVTKGTDWPTIVTGVVGVAGIIGTYWQGKRAREATSQDLRDSLSAETDRALRTDRRVVYANLLAMITKMTNAAAMLTVEWAENRGKDARLALRSAHVQTLTELYVAGAEVNLIAPDPIWGAATTTIDFFTDYANELLSNKEPDFRTFENTVMEHVRLLCDAMRADLDVSVKPEAAPSPSSR